MKAPILAAVDFSPGSDIALRAADQLARGEDVPLVVVHSFPDPLPHRSLLPHEHLPDMLAAEKLEHRAFDAVRAHVERITGRAQHEFDVQVRVDEPWVGVVRVAQLLMPSRIVVGSRGETNLPAMLLGSVAAQIIRHAPVDVLVVREAEHAGPVLATSDLSEPSYTALRAGAAEAKRLAAPLVVVSVLPPPPPPFLAAGGLALDPALGWSPERQEAARGAAKRVLSDALESTGAKGELRIEEGAAGPTIVRLAATLDARLLTVATHGRTGLARALLGSTAEWVARHAPCSVLVARLGK